MPAEAPGVAEDAGLELLAHPFSSYSQKVLVALYENGTPFAYRSLADPANGARLAALSPMRRFPVLVDRGRAVIETSVIVEYLDLHHPGPAPMLPRDPVAALEARLMDRFFDGYVMGPMMTVVYERARPEGNADPYGVRTAKEGLAEAYRWLDGVMAGREWAAGEAFGLADCAAAPSLFYADWVLPIPEALGHLRAYRARLLTRPSFARCVEEARPYRENFPLGAPDRD